MNKSIFTRIVFLPIRKSCKIDNLNKMLSFFRDPNKQRARTRIKKKQIKVIERGRVVEPMAVVLSNGD